MSLPTRVDLEPIINGDSAAIVIDVVNSADESLSHPLTGWVFRLTAKHSKYQGDDEAVIQITVVTNNSTQIVFSFSPEDTRQLMTTTLDYDIQVSDASGDAVSTPWMGKLRIKRGVTEAHR